MNPRSPWKPTFQDGWFLLSLAVGSVLTGWIVNHLRAQPVPIPFVAPRPVVMGGDLTLAEFANLARESDGVVVDARPRLFYDMGHVPGAISLPEEDFAAEFPRLRERLESAREIAVYCADADCEDARQLQVNFTKRGRNQVAVYPDGWQGWTGAGRPVEKSKR